MSKKEDGFELFYNEFKDWTKKQLLNRIYDIILKDTEEIGEKDKEIERLNNIIEELEKWLDNNSRHKELFECDRYYQEILNKLKELKEGNNNENNNI